MSRRSTTEEPEPTPALLRTWIARFLVFAVLLFGWTVALPDFSGPDEPAHVLRAAAVAGGDLETEDRGLGDAQTVVTDIPRSLKLGSPIAVCYVFNPNTTPCGPPFAEDDTPDEGITTAGTAPPLFYGLVGLPLRLEASARGLLLARLVNAGACAALFATAAVFALRARRRRFLLTGLAIAVTPMACYLAVVVSPSGLEIAAGIATWVLLLVAASAGRSIPPGMLAALTVAASVLVLSRALSAVYMVLIFATVVLALGWEAFDPRRRQVKVAAGVLAAAFLAAGAWVVTHDPTELVPAIVITPHNAFDTVMVSVGKTGSNLEQMIAAFGWLEFRIPHMVHVAWVFAAGVLLLFVAHGVRERRGQLALGLVVAASFLIPIAIEARGYARYGPIWQGRYILPIAVGIPLLSGVLLDRAGSPIADLLDRPRRTLIWILWLAHCVAFWILLRRYTMGADASVLIPLHPEWSPRLHPWVLAVIVFGASAEWARWLIRSGDADGRPDAHDDAVATEARAEALKAAAL